MGDRPKKSWREIDSKRDRGGGGGGISRLHDRERLGMGAERASKSYRAALDALFERGEVGKIAEKLSPPAQSSSTATPTASSETPSARRRPKADSAATPVEDETRAALRKKLLAAIGRDEITRATDRYVRKFGMPEDYELLEQAVEHHDTDRVLEAFDVLGRMLDVERPKRSRTLQGKLRFIEETSDDADLRTLAAQLRARL